MGTLVRGCCACIVHCHKCNTGFDVTAVAVVGSRCVNNINMISKTQYLHYSTPAITKPCTMQTWYQYKGLRLGNHRKRYCTTCSTVILCVCMLLELSTLSSLISRKSHGYVHTEKVVCVFYRRDVKSIIASREIRKRKSFRKRNKFSERRQVAALRLKKN